MLLGEFELCSVGSGQLSKGLRKPAWTPVWRLEWRGGAGGREISQEQLASAATVRVRWLIAGCEP